MVSMNLYVLSLYVYVLVTHFIRYLGLFGDHIVPAVRYTQVLRRPDLVNSLVRVAKEIVPVSDWNEV